MYSNVYEHFERYSHPELENFDKDVEYESFPPRFMNVQCGKIPYNARIQTKFQAFEIVTQTDFSVESAGETYTVGTQTTREYKNCA